MSSIHFDESLLILLHCGIPQSSIIQPKVLFLYINDLSVVTSSSNYANDCTLHANLVARTRPYSWVSVQIAIFSKILCSLNSKDYFNFSRTMNKTRNFFDSLLDNKLTRFFHSSLIILVYCSHIWLDSILLTLNNIF